MAEAAGLWTALKPTFRFGVRKCYVASVEAAFLLDYRC